MHAVDNPVVAASPLPLMRAKGPPGRHLWRQMRATLWR